MALGVSCVFGIARPALSRDSTRTTTQFARLLSEYSGIDVVAAHIGSYDELGVAFGNGRVHLAWLPPIPFLAMHHAGIAIPLVGHQRSGATTFTSVLVVANQSEIQTLEALKGARAAWTDPLSASGFVLPRLYLAELGLDPKGLFASEAFFGSHERATRAVKEGRAEVAGTYARIDEGGLAVSGGWTTSGAPDEAHKLRVLHMFEKVPADVIAAHRSVAHEDRAALAAGLIAVAKTEEGAPLCRAIFGVDGFLPWASGEHEKLRIRMSEAAVRGVLDSVDLESGD